MFINYFAGLFHVCPCLGRFQAVFVEHRLVVEQHFPCGGDGEQVDGIFPPLCNFLIHARRHALFEIGHANLRVIDIGGKVYQKVFFHIVDGVRGEHGHHIRARAIAHSLHQLGVKLAVRLLLGHHLIFVLRGVEGIYHFQQRFFVRVCIGVPQHNLRFFAAGLALCTAGGAGRLLPAATGKQHHQHGNRKQKRKNAFSTHFSYLLNSNGLLFSGAVCALS